MYQVRITSCVPCDKYPIYAADPVREGETNIVFAVLREDLNRVILTTLTRRTYLEHYQATTPIGRGRRVSARDAPDIHVYLQRYLAEQKGRIEPFWQDRFHGYATSQDRNYTGKPHANGVEFGPRALG